MEIRFFRSLPVLRLALLAQLSASFPALAGYGDVRVVPAQSPIPEGWALVRVENVTGKTGEAPDWVLMDLRSALPESKATSPDRDHALAI